MEMLHDDLTSRIIASAIAIHRVVGPGLAEQSYQAAMAIEMTDRGLSFSREPTISVDYKGVVIGQHRPDFIVEEQVILELKAVRAIEPVFAQQVLTYLRITGLKVGLLINFNVEALKFGVKRIVN